MDSKENSGQSLRGKRCICLVRQSSDADGTTSTQAQLEWLHAEAKRQGMVIVDDVVLEGVSGSLPGNRADLNNLLTRYDVLLVQRMDRLTRGGSYHGFWFEFEVTRAGKTVLYPGDNLPTGPYSGLIKAALFDAAREQARSIGQRSVQGWMYSVNQGRNCVISRTPYGCDRLYLSSEGKPIFIIRNLGDGRQQKLHPETGAVIDTYGSIGGGTKGHYRKQKEERVQIVPGAPEAVRTVQAIFDLHYDQRLGGKRIADVLNRRGTLSPEGGGWSQRQVESLYENPIYTGWALGSRLSQGIYFRRGHTTPEEVNLDQQTLATCHAAPRQLRPPADWQWQEQPRMKNFLAPDLAAKALAAIKEVHEGRWAHSIDPMFPKRSPNKHKASQYILTGLLFARQDGADLTGVLCGPAGRRVRYYRHRRKNVGYIKGAVFNKMIPAEPLERAILELIRQVVADVPDLRGRIIKAVIATAPAATAEEDLAALRQRREAVAAKVRLIVKTLDEATLADAHAELDSLSQQRAELERQIAQAEQAQQYAQEDPDVLADRVLERLGAAGAGAAILSPAAARDLLEAFVERVEVDMATKDAEVHLRLPAWAMAPTGELRPAHNSPSSTVRETHWLAPVRLGTAACHYVLSSRVCYRCRRKRAAG